MAMTRRIMIATSQGYKVAYDKNVWPPIEVPLVAKVACLALLTVLLLLGMNIVIALSGVVETAEKSVWSI